MSFRIATSQTLGGPGVYLVMAANLTLTVPSWLPWPDPKSKYVIKDGTGNGNPNITLTGGTFDGAASYVINAAYQAVELLPNPYAGAGAGNAWILA